jgi:5-methylcytosine-specific restriction endonuclease McrA
MYDRKEIRSQSIEELSHTRRRISRSLADPDALPSAVAQATQAQSWVQERERTLERAHLKQCQGVSFKLCSRCGKRKPVDNSPFGFGFRSERPKSQCKACDRETTAAHHAANPEIGRQRATKHSKRRPLKVTLSNGFKVLFRAAQGDRCAYCGRELAGGGELDHWTPIEQGGEDSPWNLVYACRGCNRDKGRKTPAQFKAVLVANGLSVRKGGFFRPRKDHYELYVAASKNDPSKR